MNAAERATIEGLADRLHRAANGGHTATAGRDVTRGEFKTLVRETRDALLQLAAVKGGKVAKPKACPHAAAVRKMCDRPAYFGHLRSRPFHTKHQSEQAAGKIERARYLDTFGEAGSPEREVQRVRLDAMPVYAQFSYEGTPKGMKDDAARLWLTGRMEQFERDEREAIVQARAQRVRDERYTLQSWAIRNRPTASRFGYFTHRPTAEWPREEALAA